MRETEPNNSINTEFSNKVQIDTAITTFERRLDWLDLNDPEWSDEVSSGNRYLDAITFQTVLSGVDGPPYSSKNLTIYYSITGGPEFFNDNVNQLIQDIESFLDINFVQVSSDYSNFDIVYKELDGFLGRAETPEFLIDKDFIEIEINSNDEVHSEEFLYKGSFGYVTIIHEIGHGLGLSHPHEGSRLADPFPGVTSTYDDLGDYNLNQGIYTTMGYNSGYYLEYPNQSYDNPKYGFEAGFMALDIAALQHVYGANEDFKSSNNTYLLSDDNVVGTYWECIWDTDGVDTISAQNLEIGCVINLKSASLTGPGAGGYLSSANGINGGYTIAHGVKIENAEGSNKSDTIVGNNFSNTIRGNNGNDTLTGGNGNDRVFGGAGRDTIYLDNGRDIINGGSGIDKVAVSGNSNATVNLSKAGNQNTGFGTDKFVFIEDIDGGGGNDKLYGSNAANKIYGFDGADRLFGRNGNDTLSGGDGNDFLKGDANNDKLYGGNGNDRLYLDAGTDLLNGGTGADYVYATGNVRTRIDLASTQAQNTGYGNDRIMNIENIFGGGSHDTFFGNSGRNIIRGNNGNDTINGRNGNDLIFGGRNNDKLTGSNGNDTLKGDHGADRLFGGAGKDKLYAGVDSNRDVFVYTKATDSKKGSKRDLIYNFDSGEDDILLKGIDADTSTNGNQSFSFSDGAAGNSVWTQTLGTNNLLVRGDVNGDSVYDFEIQLIGITSLNENDFIL